MTIHLSGEFDGMAWWRQCLFWLGVLIICLGVGILSVVTENRKMRAVPPIKKLKAAMLAVVAHISLLKLIPYSERNQYGYTPVGTNDTLIEVSKDDEDASDVSGIFPGLCLPAVHAHSTNDVLVGNRSASEDSGGIRMCNIPF